MKLFQDFAFGDPVTGRPKHDPIDLTILTTPQLAANDLLPVEAAVLCERSHRSGVFWPAGTGLLLAAELDFRPPELGFQPVSGEPLLCFIGGSWRRRLEWRRLALTRQIFNAAGRLLQSHGLV